MAGPLMGEQAIELAIGKARATGAWLVNTFNGNPIGLLGHYANLAAEKGMIGLVMANTSPAAAPFGGTSMVLGTNPFAYAAPSAKNRPILFDIATTVASCGKVQRARRRGDRLPHHWLIGRDGKPVTDPDRAEEGVFQTCGGHKGSGLAILIHLPTGALSGTTVGGEDTHDHPGPERRGQGAMFIALAPGFFASAAVFEELVERPIGYIHAAAPLPGRSRPIYPGERGWTELDRRQRVGIEVPDEDRAVVLKALRTSALDLAALTAGIA